MESNIYILYIYYTYTHTHTHTGTWTACNWLLLYKRGLAYVCLPTKILPDNFTVKLGLASTVPEISSERTDRSFRTVILPWIIPHYFFKGSFVKGWQSLSSILVVYI